LPDEADLPAPQVENENPADFAYSAESRKLKVGQGIKPYNVAKTPGKKVLPEHRNLQYIKREKDNRFRLLNGGEQYGGSKKAKYEQGNSKTQFRQLL